MLKRHGGAAMTQQPPKTDRPDEANERAPVLRPSDIRNKHRLDLGLDRELEDSFPASDPPSSTQPICNSPAGDPDFEP
jgi:hypothetical protein